MCNFIELLNFHLLELGPQLFNNLGWYGCHLLSLKLTEPFIEMIFTFVRIVDNFFKDFLFFFVGRFLVGKYRNNKSTRVTDCITRITEIDDVAITTLWTHFFLFLDVSVYVFLFDVYEIVCEDILTFDTIRLNDVKYVVRDRKSTSLNSSH